MLFKMHRYPNTYEILSLFLLALQLPPWRLSPGISIRGVVCVGGRWRFIKIPQGVYQAEGHLTEFLPFQKEREFIHGSNTFPSF